MGKLVSNSQNAFVEGRQILDVVLVANEAIDSRKRSVGIALVCKLDIEKAYDHVNWRFLLSVLEKMGFGPKWRNWIFFCISTVRMAVLVNGTPTDFFSTFRGLRQGDPLSPYLFVLIMEAFSSLISRAEENGFIRGFKATGRSGEGVLVSYLLFADHTFLFFGGVEEVYRAAAVFGCKVENLPTNYLGLPLGASHKSCRVWDGESETQIEKIQREFLWGDMEEKRKIHLVRWAVICKDKRHGGLGLRYLKEFNHALLGKWLWRFPTERESFWRRVIVGKFGEVQGGWTTREVRESYGTGLWKDIRKGWEEFFLRTRICIGNGRRTRFWWDIWVGDSKLKDLFPLLFRIAAHNSAVVVDLWGRQEVKVQKGEDFLVWKIERKGIFKVQSYYRSLKEDNSPLFPTKEVWGSYAPLRTRFFAWEAVWGKTSTVDMLMRRGWSMVNRCNLCKENEETTNNILIHCVYLGRAKSKNLPRGRDVRYELEETLSSVPA
ncbi:putative ribonuclease H protein [Vitis vinifera]|uniref:Putative ribonuclease H protein n=1 Tax=Vitis vinifera TaxID=29760 RepID=A0A438D425_VITVI|nr:putative ribonuclease H protein [Vitis vinifera]